MSHSIVSRSITVHQDAFLFATIIAKTLDAGGFEVYDMIADPQRGIESSESSSQNRLEVDWVEKFYNAIDR